MLQGGFSPNEIPSAVVYSYNSMFFTSKINLNWEHATLPMLPLLNTNTELMCVTLWVPLGNVPPPRPRQNRQLVSRSVPPREARPAVGMRLTEILSLFTQTLCRNLARLALRGGDNEL